MVFFDMYKKGWLFKCKFSMFSHEKGYKIRAKVHGKGGILLTSRLAYAPLLDWTAVAGTFRWFNTNAYQQCFAKRHGEVNFTSPVAPLS